MSSLGRVTPRSRPLDAAFRLDRKHLGRGPAGKTEVVGAMDRDTKQVTAKMVS